MNDNYVEYNIIAIITYYYHYQIIVNIALALITHFNNLHCDKIPSS